MDKYYIKNIVKEEMGLYQKHPDHHRPSQYRIYIFFMIKSGLILFNDTIINQEVLSDLLESDDLKSDGFHFHQTEQAIRYKFTGFKYPYYYYRVIPQDIRDVVFKRDNYSCVKCNSQHKLSIDHIMPWSYGGITEEYNLQTLCRSCNSIKHNN